MSSATTSVSDTRLTRQAIRGSSRAFEAIFERYHQELYRYCAAILGNGADAEDAVQSTMVKVLQALPGEERRIELKPWLYRIAHNQAIEIIRRRVPSGEIDVDSLLGSANAAERAEVRDHLWRLVADVAELPERQRGALVMRELGGLGFDEIGAALGTSAATARQTLYEARLGLRTMSEGREMECAEALRAISEGDRRLLRGRKLRAHLRACEGCRAFRDEIECRRADLALIAPLPTATAAGILHSLLGGALGGSAATAGGAAVGAAAAAGKSLLSTTAFKVAAVIGLASAIGVAGAEKSGLIHLDPGHPQAPAPAKLAPARAEAAAGAAVSPVLVPPATAGNADQGQAARPGSARPLRHPAGRVADGSAQQPRSPASPPAVTEPTAEAPPPALGEENGRHLGQREHPAHGQPAAQAANGAAGSGSRGKSGLAPGHTKPPPVKPTHPEPAQPEPAHPGRPHAKSADPGLPPVAVPPNQAKKSPPAARAEDPAAAEPAAMAAGKARLEPATP